MWRGGPEIERTLTAGSKAQAWTSASRRACRSSAVGSAAAIAAAISRAAIDSSAA